MRRASLLVFIFYLLVLPLAGMGQNPAAAGQNEAEMLKADLEDSLTKLKKMPTKHSLIYAWLKKWASSHSMS